MQFPLFHRLFIGNANNIVNPFYLFDIVYFFHHPFNFLLVILNIQRFPS